MVQINENISEALPKPEKESLLKKFDIPLDHLDFKYLETCKNDIEIEKIVKILRSGQEGHFPDLTKYAEQRLFEVNPKSKLLQISVPVLSKRDIPQDEWTLLSSDLEKWIEDANKNDKELTSFHDVQITPIAPVRESQKLKNKKAEDKSERIKSMDYAAWDKLDPDAEILKMEIKEEKMKEEILKKAKEKEKLNTVVLDPDLMTKAELSHAALHAKTSGNETYKLGEYEEALQYYTNSLIFLPSAAVYNNRAITNIKLKNYKDAIKDCNEVLKLETNNEKAYLRKSTAHKYLKEYDKAMDTLETLLQIHPNSVDAQNIIRDIKRLTGNTEKVKTVRMKIVDESGEEKKDKEKKIDEEESNKRIKDKENHKITDICNNKSKNINDTKVQTKKPNSQNTSPSKINKSVTINEESRDNVLVPIPSTSRFSGPFYRVLNVPTDIAKKLTNTKITRSKSDENVIDLNLPENRVRKKLRQVKSEQNESVQKETPKKSDRVDKCNNTTEKTKCNKENQNKILNGRKSIINQGKTKSSSMNRVKFEDQENENLIQNGKKPYQVENISGTNKENGVIHIDKCTETNNKEEGENKVKNGTRNCYNYKENTAKNKDNENGKRNSVHMEKSINLENSTNKSPKETKISKNYSPYEFLKYWQAIKIDPTLEEHEELLRALNPSDLIDVVGNKLDGEMLSLLLKCLVTRFTKENDIMFIQNILSELHKISRINIIMLFMNENDKSNIRSLISRIKDEEVQKKISEIYNRLINI